MGEQSKIIFFDKPVTVIRYVPLKITWCKAEYKALASRLPKWDKQVILGNGNVVEGNLQLSSSVFQEQIHQPVDTLILYGRHEAFWTRLLKRNHYLPFFLQLHQKDQDIWIELFDNYYPLFGSKRRDQFDLMPLHPGKSVAIHINARFWHTMAGKGMGTNYVEQFLFLEHLGTFEQAEIVENLEQCITLQPQREIDLRQLLF